MTQKLTNITIRNCKPGDVLRDDKVTGLHLRVFAKRKTFYLYFRTKAGQERRPKIGDHPTISLDKAREISRGWLEMVAAGKDPVAGWAEEAAAPTVDDLCKTYMLKHGARKKTGKADQLNINKHILPRIGKKKVRDVSHNDIDDIHAAMSDHPYGANRVIALLSKMFSLAERWQMRDPGSNPARGVQKYREHKRKRYMHPEEAIAIYNRLVHYGDTYPQQAAFLWLLIFTGARPSEIANATQDQRVGDRFELVEHKTDGAKDVRIVFLPPQAVEVLDKLPKTRSGTVTGIKSPKHLWLKIREDTKIKDLRMYDLRHSFASAGLMAGLSLDQIGELLGHKSSLTTKRYVHLIEEMGVAKATKAADFLETMMRPQPAKTEEPEEGEQPCEVSQS